MTLFLYLVNEILTQINFVESRLRSLARDLSRISRIFARAPLVLSAMPSVGVRMVNASGVMRYLCESVIIRGRIEKKILFCGVFW